MRDARAAHRPCRRRRPGARSARRHLGGGRSAPCGRACFAPRNGVALLLLLSVAAAEIALDADQEAGGTYHGTMRAIRSATLDDLSATRPRRQVDNRAYLPVAERIGLQCRSGPLHAWPSRAAARRGSDRHSPRVDRGVALPDHARSWRRWNARRRDLRARRSGAPVDPQRTLREALAGSPPEWFDCIRSALARFPNEGSYNRRLAPGLISSRWLGVVEQYDDYCGGNHPNHGQRYRTFELSSGRELDLHDWFNPSAVMRQRWPGSEDETKTLQPALRTLILAGWRAEGDCEGVVEGQEYWKSAWPGSADSRPRPRSRRRRPAGRVQDSPSPGRPS